MEKLFSKSIRKTRDVELEFKRSIYERIDWSDRLILIRGARGVGKTTLLLQYIYENHGLSEQVLYVSLDDIWFSNNRLSDLAEKFVQLGGTHLLLDEAHKYPDWSREVKNLYDDYPDLNLVVTGSSSLHLHRGNVDLSRRAAQYSLHELSLREYLEMRGLGRFQTYSLDEILDHHREVAAELSSRIAPLKYFHEYLESGAYPYALENLSNYYDRLQETVTTVLESDLPAIQNMDYRSIQKLKKLMYVVATSVPFKPNISELSRKIEISRDSLLRYLHYLKEAQLILLLQSGKKGMSFLSKPEKIYLHNPNLMKSFAGDSVKTGALRETFFLNQVSQAGTVYSHSRADFLVDNQFVFEVGGKKKTHRQIQGLDHAFIVSDEIEIGIRNRIPLWLFGFLY